MLRDTWLGGARDRTSHLPVTSQPALPPEPRAQIDLNANIPIEITFLSIVSQGNGRYIGECVVLATVKSAAKLTRLSKKVE